MEDLTSKTEEELRVVAGAGEAALAELNRRSGLEAKEIRERMERHDTFKVEELRFAKTAECPCGAKLAYPKKSGPNGSWDCSAILMHTTPLSGQPGSVLHTDERPFVFWDIKAEDES